MKLNTILRGDALEVLRTLPSEAVHCVVTSPPYWGLRDYGCSGQIGLEPTPQEYLERMEEVFREVRRVLRKDGTAWVNIGDTWKDKQMLGMPWRLALDLQADGWWLRSEIIWAKPNPMPSSVKDRPTVAHETIFLLTKSQRYFYDHEAVTEEAVYANSGRKSKKRGEFGGKTANIPGKEAFRAITDTRSLRSVWTIPTHPFPEAHFATFPPRLAETCIKAGCPVGGVVLDPFSGAGTSCLVASKLGRSYVGIELNPQYAAMAERRIREASGLLLAAGVG